MEDGKIIISAFFLDINWYYLLTLHSDIFFTTRKQLVGVIGQVLIKNQLMEDIYIRGKNMKLCRGIDSMNIYTK